MEFEGYCVKCREKRTIEKGEVKTTPNGRQMAQGKCPVCGTTVTRFMAGGNGGGGGEGGSRSRSTSKAGGGKSESSGRSGTSGGGSRGKGGGSGRGNK